MQKSIDFDKPVFRPQNNPESQHSTFKYGKKLNKQCLIVLEALQRGEHLTTASALIKYGIGDLRRRIKDLKDIYKVEKIESKRIPHDNYHEYFINQE
jgi:hypothetical protein